MLVSLQQISALFDQCLYFLHYPLAVHWDYNNIYIIYSEVKTIWLLCLHTVLNPVLTFILPWVPHPERVAVETTSDSRYRLLALRHEMPKLQTERQCTARLWWAQYCRIVNASCQLRIFKPKPQQSGIIWHLNATSSVLSKARYMQKIV